MRESNCRKGFTLTELLIVVAIIAVLVAVSVPVFTSQLEKSREATDLANVRAGYAEVMTAAISDDKTSSVYDELNKQYSCTVYLKQKEDGWTTKKPLVVGGVSSDDLEHWRGDVKANGRCEIIFDIVKNSVILKWDGYILKNDYQWKKINGKWTISEGAVVPGNWPASAITEALAATNNSGMTLNVAAITSANSVLTQGIEEGYLYQIGYFILLPDGEELYNSGRKTITNVDAHYEISANGANDGAEVKVAVQMFKVKADAIDARSYEISDAEARELERLISIS